MTTASACELRANSAIASAYGVANEGCHRSNAGPSSDSAMRAGRRGTFLDLKSVPPKRSSPLHAATTSGDIPYAFNGVAHEKQ